MGVAFFAAALVLRDQALRASPQHEGGGFSVTRLPCSFKSVLLTYFRKLVTRQDQGEERAAVENAGSAANVPK
jgi:hypothetical protein